MPEPDRPSPRHYAFSILTVVVAVLLTLAFQSVLQHTRFALLFAAVALSAWYGGLGPALFSVALAILTGAYFILPPGYSFVLGLDEVINLGVFVIVAVLISSLSAASQRAERATRESESRLSTTLQSIGDAVIATDDQGRVTFMNPVAQKLTGWASQEAIGEDFQNVFHIINEHSRQSVENPVTQILREGAVVGLANHTVLIAKDGSEKPIDDSGAPIKDAEGHTIGVILVFHDITERKQVEEKLQRSRKLFNQALESARMGAWEWNIQTGEINWSDTLEPIHGLAPGTFKGTFEAFLELIHPEDRERVTGTIARAVEGGTDYDTEFRIVWPDGSVHWIEGTGQVFRDSATGRPIQMAGLGIDITERKRAEELRTRLAAIVESSNDAIIGKTLDGIITSWNRGAEKIYSYRAEEVIGRSISILIPPSHRDELPRILDRLKRGEHIDNYETVRTRKDGKQIDISLTISPIKDADGHIIGASTIARDITERKRAEGERAQLLSSEQAARRQAEEASRAKDEFLATMSHELRTPLTAMLGWVRLLGTGQLDEAMTARAIETIERNVKAQTQLVEDLLDVSRIITGKLRLDVRTIEPAGVIEATIDSVRLSAEAKDVRLQSALDPKAGPVLSDPDRLQQIVWNLLSNAIKFTPRGGRVEVQLKRVDSHAEIVVSDTGQGIEKEFLPFVFDRFRQADSTSTRKYGGLGLGLAIVRHLTEMHGGSVHVESEGTGHGAIFTVKLPLISARLGEDDFQPIYPPADRQLPAADAAALRGVYVLVVDDEADARDLLSLLLEQSGAQVRSVASAAEALRALDEATPDVLVSDIEMPGEDGYTLIGKIREREAAGRDKSSIPAVALTAYARTEDRMRALSPGFQIHVPKPVEPAELIMVVASLAKRT